jgi:hypothetical protein
LNTTITAYGALPDGKTNAAAAIQSAVDEVSAAGGGRVTVPAGRYLSGSVLLKDNIELYLEPGAVLISSLDPSMIKPFPHTGEGGGPDGWQGGFFLGAVHAKHVKLAGQGTLYGQGDRVFSDPGLDGGFAECPKQCADFRPRLLLFEDVEDLTVQDVTMQDSAFWTLHMAGCRHVQIQRVRVENDDRGANNDGIDPDSCSDVLIEGCMVSAGDDAIVIKSTEAMAKRYGPCENIVIRGCILHSRDSALKIGTETFGVIRNVILSDCVVKDCSRGIGIWVRDGGTVEGITIHHISGAVRRYADMYRLPGSPGWWGKGEPLFVSATPRKGKTGSAGTIRRIFADHIDLTVESSLFLGGEKDSPIRNVKLSDLHIRFMHQGTQPGGFFDEQPSSRGVYAHAIPAIYARCVKGLILRDSEVSFEGQGEVFGEMLTELEDCTETDAVWRKESEEVWQN